MAQDPRETSTLPGDAGGEARRGIVWRDRVRDNPGIVPDPINDPRFMSRNGAWVPLPPAARSGPSRFCCAEPIAPLTLGSV